jgi:hypothetical protein
LKVTVWRSQNPSGQFKDFYAEKVERSLRKGKPHRTLGANLIHREYGTSGKQLFETLVTFGLKPNDMCVDYGCGTLRIGVHAIKYLAPGAYWGMDVSHFVLQQGRELLGDPLWTEKRPNLRVISTESVAEVAANGPAMLFSNRVLFHVHPDELSEYFRNIIKIIGVSGQAIITGDWSIGETFQRGQSRWAHAISRIRNLAEAEGGVIEMISERECSSERFGQTAGLIRIVAPQVPR